MGSITNNNTGRSIVNYALPKEETESAVLQGLQFSYSEAQFIVTVNGKYEKILKSSIEGDIYFETESLKITPDISRPTTNIVIKNKTQSDISYTINILPWADPYGSDVKKLQETVDSFSASFLQKVFPAIEFVPSNSVTTLTHNLSKSAGEISLRIIDYSDLPIVKRPVFGKLVGGQFQYGDILISQNPANPANAIDVKFLGLQKPGYCFFRLEGRSLVLELLDNQNKNFNYTNRNLIQGKSESVNHNMDLDVSLLPVNIKIEYLVSGKPISVPGNKPRTASFTRIGSKLFLNVIPSDLLVGESNLGLSVSSESSKNILVLENNINSSDNNFESVGFTLDVNASFVGITVYLELAHISRNSRSYTFE